MKDRPSQHIWQKDVQRHGGRTILLRQRNRSLAAVGHDPFEPFDTNEVEQYTRIVRIVVHDQHHAVTFVDALPIIGDNLFGLRDGENRQRRRAGPHL